MILVSPRLLAFAIASITIVSVSVYVVLSESEDTTPPMRMIGDMDHDGIPDDRDRVANGNAGVSLTVAEFKAKEGCGNWLPLGNPACDPEFKVKWDIDVDGIWDDSWSRQYSDTNNIDLVLQREIDIPDDATRLRIIIRVIDRDGDDTIDFWSKSFERWGYIELSLTEGAQRIELHGKGEVGASLVVQSSVVKLS